MKTTKELIDEIKAKLDSLVTELKKPRLWPVKRKVSKTIEVRLRELHAALSSKDDSEKIEANIASQISDILTSIEPDLPESAAWDVADSLKEILPRVAHDRFLYSALIEEQQREGKSHPWKNYFPESLLKEHITAYTDANQPFNSKLIADQLVTLYKIRDDEGRHNRAREGMRHVYLKNMAAILTVGIASIIGLWWWAECYPHAFLLEIAIVIVTGAVGALLSGTLKLRNINFIDGINAVLRTMGSQAVLGSLLAVIVLIILKTKIISIVGFDLDSGNTDLYFVIGLISGYSEPFAFGILEKVAKLGK